MKTSKFYAILWLIIISIAQANAESFWKNNIQYNTLSNGSNEVEVIGSETNVVNIPSTVSYEGITYSVTRIGNSAFRLKGITSITLPNTITSIGDEAFYWNGTALQSIELPSSLISIGKWAFHRCYGLTQITLPNNVENIDSYAFYECTNLASVTLSSNLQDLGDHTFSKCTSLNSISVPSNVQKIGAGAFEDCSALTSLTIKNGVKIIGADAFKNCKKLNNVTVPNSVEDIGSYAFYSCSGLKVISLGTGLKHIGLNAFYGTSCISTGYIGKYLIRGSSDGVIANGTVLIADGAFSTTGVSNVVVPGCVKYVGNRVFELNYTSLRSIVFSEGVISIGDSLYYNNDNVTSVSLPSTIQNIGQSAFYVSAFATPTINWNVKTYKDFTLDTKLLMKSGTKFVFGDSVEHIPAYLCYGITGNITLGSPQNLRTIGAHAFQGCTGLTHLEISDDVSFIGEYAFAGCSSITQIDLGTGLAKIEDGVFLSCSKLDHIYIPSNITELGNKAFQNCSKLTRLTNPSNSIISIGNNCFQRCTTLANFDIPISVQTLGSYAFANCSALTTLTWGQDLSALRNGTFADCSKLVSIELTNNITNIGDSCFYNCIKLSNLKGDSLQHIGSAAFANCSVLKNFTFEEKISSLGNNLFIGCKALKVFTWNVPNYTFSQYTPFFGAEYDIRANIDTVHFGNMVETIPQKLCADMSNLKKIYVGSSVNNMNYQKILGCNSLYEINVAQDNSYLVSEDGVVFSVDKKELKVYPPAKQGTTYSIPISVEEIAEGAFYNCLKITSMKIENNVQNIGKSAFEGCMKLGSITLGENVEAIGQRAFYNDSILSSINSNVINIPLLTPDVFLYYRPKTHQEVDHTRKMYLYIAEHRKSEYEALPVWKNMIMVTHRAEGIWKVTWKDWDSTTLKEEYVNDGESATPPAEPSREGYIFTGWDKSYTNIHQDITINATYSKNTIYYTITYLDWDDTELFLEQVEEGKDAVGPSTLPTREGYTFIGWSESLINIQKDMTVIAQYQLSEGIEDIYSDTLTPTKILYNGQIYILRGDKIYSIQGQEVK